MMNWHCDRSHGLMKANQTFLSHLIKLEEASMAYDQLCVSSSQYKVTILSMLH